MMDDRPGCLSGIFKFFLLGWLYDWLQDTFGSVSYTHLTLPTIYSV